jgi:hypothetical protein
MDNKVIEKKEGEYANLRRHLIADHGLTEDVADEICAVLAEKEQGVMTADDVENATTENNQKESRSDTRKHLITDHGLTEDMADEVCNILAIPE